MTTVVKADTKTGRLVRSVVIQAPVTQAPAIQAPQSPALTPERKREINRMIDAIAGEQGVEAPLVHSVIRAESNYNTTAVSQKGAQGIMQLIPATARRFGVSNTFDAHENIEGGVRYLRFLLDYYRGDYVRAIAAYNAGEAAVDKYHGIPPYSETRNYVSRVAENLAAARASGTKAAGATLKAVNVETTRPIQTSTGSDGRIYYRTP